MSPLALKDQNSLNMLKIELTLFPRMYILLINFMQPDHTFSLNSF